MSDVILSDGTSASDAQAAVLRQSIEIRDNTNAQRKTIYLQRFNNWKISVDAGRASNEDPPKPPSGVMLASPDADGYVFPIEGGPPVCDMPPIPEDAFHHAPLVPNTIDVGKSIGGKWHSVGPRDTFPAGKTTPPVTSSDGVTGTFEKYGAAVGAGWYLQVS